MKLPNRNNPYHLLYLERTSIGLKFNQGRVKEHLTLQYSIKTSGHTELLVGDHPKTFSGCKSVKKVQNLIINFSSKLRAFLNISIFFM